MVDAAPFEEYLSGLDIQLLNDALYRYAILGAADRGEVPWHRVVDRDQCGVLRADEELVVVPVIAVGGPEPGYLAVGAVEDHRAALPGAALLRSDEDVTRGGFVVRLCGHLDGGWVKVRTRAEGEHPVRRRVWNAWQGFDLWGARGIDLRGASGRFAAHRACKRQIRGAGAHRREKPAPREPRAQRGHPSPRARVAS